MKNNKDLCQKHCRVCSLVCDERQEIDNKDVQWNYDIYHYFPVKIVRNEGVEQGPIFESHWHEQFQILYFEQGEALVHCNSKHYRAKPGDVMVINKNEIHYGEALCPDLIYSIVKVDLNFLLSSQVDFCQTKYINPLLQGRIRFQNHITQDEQLAEQIQRIVKEYYQQEIGCELAVKAHIYHIIVLLLRNYKQDVLFDRQQKNMYQLRTILKYMDHHYSENISLPQLAGLANMSNQHFCRIFKTMTGKRPVDYMNYLRINKAVTLLADSDLNISEVAMRVGFDDSNYFSRLFKKYKKTSPSAMRK